MPRVSIIVPAYNAAETIAAAVSSAVAQEDAEVIVVDDGSTDETAAIIERSIDPAVLIRTDNNGVSAARNFGAASANGDWLCFLDADDTLDPEWSTLFRSLLEDEEVVLASGSVALLDVNSGNVSQVQPRPLGPAYCHLEAVLLPGAYAVRRSAFYAVGGFAEDIGYGEHHEFGLRLVNYMRARAFKETVTEKIVVHKAHDRSPSVLARYHERRLDSAEKQLERHRETLEGDTILRANLHRVAGFSAASLAEYTKAQRHYLQAWSARRRNLRDLVRAIAVSVPVLRTRIWGAAALSDAR
jgi:glycosyltransferase involved in cell wall biosynthesis